MRESEIQKLVIRQARTMMAILGFDAIIILLLIYLARSGDSCKDSMMVIFCYPVLIFFHLLFWLFLKLEKRAFSKHLGKITIGIILFYIPAILLSVGG